MVLVFSPDGTKIAFVSTATNLVGDDTNGIRDVFIKDLSTGAVTRASLESNGAQATSGFPGTSGFTPHFSLDGTMVVFGINSNLGGSNSFSLDVYLKNLVTGALTLVTIPQVNAQFSPGGFYAGRTKTFFH